MIKNIFLDGLVLSVLFLLTLNSFSTENDDGNDTIKKDGEAMETFVVLELFTSQGCSSCPPADALLEKIKNEYPENVFTLSYHVDYWNYIGWEDPFSNPSYAKKQSVYNIKFRNRTNYTPQIVVNGQEHFVGSDGQKMKAAVEKYMHSESNEAIDLNNIKREDDKLFFEFDIKGNANTNRLRAVLVLDKRVTKVKRGENKSHTLSNTNIVVFEKKIEINELSGSAYVDVPTIVKPVEKLHLVLLLENEDNDILAAAKSEIPN